MIELPQPTLAPPAPNIIRPSDTGLKRQSKEMGDWKKREESYDDRTKLYAPVAEVLVSMGLNDTHVLTDYGARLSEFDYYLRTTIDYKGGMHNVSSLLSGKDIDIFWPDGYSHFTISIDWLNRVKEPGTLVAKLEGATLLGAVFITVDGFTEKDWQQMYYETKLIPTWNHEEVAILAWKDLTK